METLADARRVVARARSAIEDGAFPATGTVAPATYTAANALAQQREDARVWGRQGPRKDGRGGKGRAPTGQAASKRGVVPGAEDDRTPYWMIMEDYFRPVTQEDLELILPASCDPRSDPAFFVPAVGRDCGALDEASLLAPSAKRPRTEPEEDAAGPEDGLRPLAKPQEEKRRSHRLVAKHHKDALDVPTPGVTSSPEQQADEPGLVWPPLQKNGEGRMESLLEACSPDDLNVLLSQMASMRFQHKSECASEANGLVQHTEAEDDSAEGSRGMSDGLRAQLQEWVCRTAEINGAGQLDQQIADLMTVHGVLGQTEQQGHRGTSEPTTRPSDPSCSPETSRLANGDAGPGVQDRGQHSRLQDFIHPLFQMLLAQPRAYNPHQAASPMQPEPSPTAAEAEGVADPPSCVPACDDLGSPQARTPGLFSFPKMATPLSDTPQLLGCLQGPGSPVTPGAKPHTDVGDGEAPNPSSVEPCSDADAPVSVRSGRKRPEVDYSRLAGGRPTPQSQLPLASKRRHRPSAMNGGDQRVSPAALAVAGVIAAGPPEGSLEDQWAQLDRAMELGVLEFAPDDEIIGETLSCQSELLQQMTANRAATASLLNMLLEQLPKLKEEWKEKEGLAEEIISAVEAIKELKGIHVHKGIEAKLDGLMGAAREAVKIRSPRPSRPPRRIYDEDFKTPSFGAGRRDQYLKEEEVDECVDPLAERRMEGEAEDAVCAVCGQGHSDPPNVIVFCERCDLAVHQECYGVTDIPPGEWLCWPCKLHEEALVRDGVPQREIRPPRYELNSQVDRSKFMEGGSRAVSCALCPVKLGAFKKTTDGESWVHVVCALWHQQTSLVPENTVLAVQGLKDIPKQRWSTKCDVCGSAQGATVKCGHTNCGCSFHPLCARRAGLLLVMRPSTRAPFRPACKLYCRCHSDAHQNRQANALDAVNASLHKAKQVPVGNKLDCIRASDSMLEDGVSEREGGSVRSRDKKSVRAQRHGELPGSSPSTSQPHLALLTGESRKRALEALAAKERDHDHMSQLRYNLECVRLLADQIKRRERLKASLLGARFERLRAMEADPAKYCHGESSQALRPGAHSLGTASALAKSRVTAPRSTRSASIKKGPSGDGLPSMSEDAVSDAQTARSKQGALGARHDGRRGPKAQGRHSARPPGGNLGARVGSGEPNNRSGSIQRGKARSAQRPGHGDNSAGPSVHGGGRLGAHGMSDGPSEEHAGSQSAGGVLKKASKPGRKPDAMRLPGERYLNNEELQNLNTELRPRGYAYVSVDQIRTQGRRGREGGGAVERR